MYNPGLFSVRQEYEMPAKKTASKKRKSSKRSAKKASAKKASAKKSAAKKRKVTKKKATSKRGRKASSRKKVAKKKSVRKKSVTRKKTSKKKASKKKASKKKASKKKTSKKKASKKKASKKKVTKKKASRKKVAKKKASKKKAAAKKVSRKKAPSKKNTTARRPIPTRAATRAHPVSKKPMPRRSKASLLSGPIHGIKPYKPKRGEDYMSPAQLEHFREILSAWKRELMFEVDRTVHHMQDEAANFPDPNDRATQESEFGLELRTRDRERKLLRKIDSALARIDDGSYGYCDETGEEIGLKRLEARPVATLCLEAQERRELAERQFRDRDDRYR